MDTLLDLFACGAIRSEPEIAADQWHAATVESPSTLRVLIQVRQKTESGWQYRLNTPVKYIGSKRGSGRAEMAKALQMAAQLRAQADGGGGTNAQSTSNTAGTDE